MTPGAVRGDLLAPASLRVACEGIERIFHCAGYAHAFTSSDPDAHRRINFEGTRNLLAAAGEAGVRRFVFLSSVKAMAEPGDACADEGWAGEPDTPYGCAKRAAEGAVLEAGAKYGMHVVNLRLSMVYGRGGRGNLERMARGIRAGWFPPLPETGNRRSLVHVEDVVAAMRLVAEAPGSNGRTYIIADSRAYSGCEIYDEIRQALGKPPAGWRVPASLLRAGGLAGDGAQALLRRPLPLNLKTVVSRFRLHDFRAIDAAEAARYRRGRV
jgi:nucleoside-diphosphate-sugar epimerase